MHKECGKIVSNLSEIFNAITGLIPKSFGKVASLSDAEQESESLTNGRRIKNAFLSQKIEGLNKNSGYTHQA